MDTETTGAIMMGVYCAIGLPVAFWHMRREQMSESDIESSTTRYRFIWLLAWMWPILFLGIAAQSLGNRLDGPPRKKGSGKDK